MKIIIFRNCITLFFFCLTICLSAQVDDVIKNYIHISKNDGIVNNNVTTISDDIYKRIWIGTAKGLNIYDSNHLTTIQRYSGSYIYSLYDTGKEMLIGTQGYVEAYNYDLGTFSRITCEEKDIEYTSSIFRYNDQVILVANGSIYSFDDGKLSLIKKNVPYHIMSVDKFGTMWALHRQMVYKIDAKFNIIKSYKLTSSDHSPLIGICLYPDSKGTIWIGTVKDGLYRYNRAFDDFRKENLMSAYNINEVENIGSINEDRYDRLWIGHNSGVAVYDYSNNYFKNYMLENSYNITLTTTITNIYKTKDKNMVLGTFFTGFFYIKELNSNIQFSNLADFSKKTGVVTANGIVKDKSNRLWVGTNCMGISLLDAKGELIKHINHSNAQINDNIVSLELDGMDNVWAGSLSTGLYKIGSGGNITHYINQQNDQTSLVGSKVYALYSLNSDSLIVASNKGVDVYMYGKNIFSNIVGATSQDYAFSDIYQYRNYIYITDLYSFFRFDRKSGKVEKFNYPQYQDNQFQCSYVDRQGRLWIGTAKGEILLFDNDTLAIYISDKKMIYNSISNIQGDSSQNLWLTSGNEIFRITPKKKVRRINLAWGLGENEFNVRSSYIDKDGVIYFGTTDGLINFRPQDIVIQDKQPPELYISDFRLFKNSVIPGESDILEKHINNTKKITLNNHQNFISFLVSSIDFTPDEGIPYKCVYMLENLDSDWYEVNPASNEITFTGLSTGKYILHIKLITEDGETLATKEIEINVRPPFLLSWYMIVLYIILLSGILWLISGFVKRQRQTKEIINKAKRKQDELTRLNSLKLDFFTYISHEFKTPLAIISTLQNEIIPISNEPDSDSNIFKRNVKRLEYLINQLMDFRNMESQHASIKIKKYDIITFVEGIYEAFTPLYKHKEIDHQFVTEIDSLPMMFDADKVEMLVGNLLSNTFKHTQQGGRCYLKIQREENVVVIDIFNSGACLSNEQKTIIFEPYYRTDTSSTYPNSGIGLAIVNSIAKLLNIELSVFAVENEGNIFRVRIPISQDDKMEISTSSNGNNILDQIIDNTMYIEEQTNLFNENSSTKFQILIVDNDSDTRKMLRKKLQDYFHVLIASTAKEALLLLKSQNMDLIISDIYMPEMDGYDFCRQVKSNPKTQHIPVFLITSELSGEARMKGFQSGADAFLQKPINIQELILRLDNILRRKNVLRDYYSGLNQLTIDKTEVNNADEIFIKELTEYINENLTDPDLSVHQLVQHTNISRTQLYLNIKRLTDQTPSQFILNIKMTNAKHLLLSTDLTSSEISYKLGYCNPNHFSRQFKEFYSVSPSEFRKQQ